MALEVRCDRTGGRQHFTLIRREKVHYASETLTEDRTST
jgi:hypothetical protein